MLKRDEYFLQHCIGINRNNLPMYLPWHNLYIDSQIALSNTYGLCIVALTRSLLITFLKMSVIASPDVKI